MSQGFARNGWPRGGDVFSSGNLVASATPHTKGAWTEIDASAVSDLVGLWLVTDVDIGVTSVDTSMLLDLGVGAAAAEVAVVSNIPFGGWASRGCRSFIPVHIPAGSRIAGRIQGAVISDIFTPHVSLALGGRPGQWGGYTVAETIGVDTATSGPTTGDLADNAWDEAVAATANPYRALTFHPCGPPGNSTWSATATMLVDVGVGNAGSERALGTWRVRATTSEFFERVEGPDFIEAGIPAGSRLAIRKNGTADLSGALIGWR